VCVCVCVAQPIDDVQKESKEHVIFSKNGQRLGHLNEIEEWQVSEWMVV
jgi:hypothetical protein